MFKLLQSSRTQIESLPFIAPSSRGGFQIRPIKNGGAIVSQGRALALGICMAG